MPTDIQNRIKHAFQELEKGKPDVAMALIADLQVEPVTSSREASGAGRLALRVGQPDAAIAFLSVVLNDEPDNVSALTAIGEAFGRSGAFDDALRALSRALELSPDRVDTHLVMGQVLNRCREYVGAREHLEKALEGEPDNAQVHGAIARSLANLGEHDTALAHARKAARLAPGNIDILRVTGMVLANLGRADEARNYFEKARRIAPSDGASFYNLAHLKKFGPADEKFVSQGEAMLQQSLPPDQRINVHFALGKVYDDCGETEKAFEHFGRGNLLAKPSAPSDPHKGFRRLRKIRFPACRDVVGDKPVFVVGMPRSGTTLLEQIISAHSNAAGAGELPHLGRMSSELAVKKRPDAAECEHGLEDYLSHLSAGRDQALRITDKMPANYQNIGVIDALMPNAHIIHIMRDPLDTCLSCFFQNFARQPWSFDLANIGRVYAGYRNIMAYWKKKLPAARMLELRYESVVEDFDGEVRRIIDFIGLPWDPACLDYVENAKGVGSASKVQVRQPIYQTSVNRWEKYAHHLGPLITEIEPWLDDEHAQRLKAFGFTLRGRSATNWRKRRLPR